MLRPSTVYLRDANGDPYSQVDHWLDQYALDDEGNQTDDVEAVLVASFRRGEDDEEISEAQYLIDMKDYEQRTAVRELEAAERFTEAATLHADLMGSAMEKLKDLGLTADEAAAVAALPAEAFAKLDLAKVESTEE